MARYKVRVWINDIVVDANTKEDAEEIACAEIDEALNGLRVWFEFSEVVKCLDDVGV